MSRAAWLKVGIKTIQLVNDLDRTLNSSKTWPPSSWAVTQVSEAGPLVSRISKQEAQIDVMKSNPCPPPHFVDRKMEMGEGSGIHLEVGMKTGGDR